jgi:archaellum component FlaF (FlaF/FlaG flagellin family)
VGGSVSISALIVGTALLGIFALASLSLSNSALSASEVLEGSTEEPEIRLLNASESNGTIHLNLTNAGDEIISFDQTWFSIDGTLPIRASDYHNQSTVLFPGETLHMQLTGTGFTTPTRLFVASMGGQSGVSFS